MALTDIINKLPNTEYRKALISPTRLIVPTVLNIEEFKGGEYAAITSNILTDEKAVYATLLYMNGKTSEVMEYASKLQRYYVVH